MTQLTPWSSAWSCRSPCSREQQRLGGVIHEAQLGIVPVRLEGGRITVDQVNSFRRYIETLARSQIYNKSVWTNNIDKLA